MLELESAKKALIIPVIQEAQWVRSVPGWGKVLLWLGGEHKAYSLHTSVSASLTRDVDENSNYLAGLLWLMSGNMRRLYLPSDCETVYLWVGLEPMRWNSNSAWNHTGTWTHSFKLELFTWWLDLLRLRLFVSQQRRNSMRGKVIGK